MDHWHGFGTALSVSQVHETTLSDGESGLSAHFVVVPARSAGGGSYLFRGLLEKLGLLRLADIPAGRVVHSLAACLVSEDVEDFLRRFDGLFEEESRHGSVGLPAHFAFAEYLTFARVIPFEWSPPPAADSSADSLGNILTAQGRGQAGYMYYEDTGTPVLFVAVPAGMVICGSSRKVSEALEAGLRHRILDLANDSPNGDQATGQTS